jgi:CDP-diacylglycerol--glycerol-3-phosphate 3-phosphatidyltransferase
MTLPNFLTLLRIFLSPVFFCVFYLLTYTEYKVLFLTILWILFFIIELSDLLDGYLARKLNKASELGKVLDPFADSLSRLTYFVTFTAAGIMPFAILLILMYRDLSVSFIRLMMLKQGTTMGARWSGKIKAWFYAAAGIGGILKLSQLNLHLPDNFIFNTIILGIFILSAVIAFISLIDYIRPLFKQKSVIKE